MCSLYFAISVKNIFWELLHVSHRDLHFSQLHSTPLCNMYIA